MRVATHVGTVSGIEFAGRNRLSELYRQNRKRARLLRLRRAQ
jgi:hypothetical protein